MLPMVNYVDQDLFDYVYNKNCRFDGMYIRIMCYVFNLYYSILTPSFYQLFFHLSNYLLISVLGIHVF